MNIDYKAHIENAIRHHSLYAIEDGYVFGEDIFDKLPNELDEYGHEKYTWPVIDDGYLPGGPSFVVRGSMLTSEEAEILKGLGAQKAKVATVRWDEELHDLFLHPDEDEDEHDYDGFVQSASAAMLDEAGYEYYMTMASGSMMYIAIPVSEYNRYPTLSVVTIPEIADNYAVTEDGVRSAISRGQLLGRQSGKTWIIERALVDARWGEWYYVLSDLVKEKQSPSHFSAVNFIIRGIDAALAYKQRLMTNLDSDVDVASVRVVSEAEAMRHYGLGEDGKTDMSEWCDWLHPETGQKFNNRADYNEFEQKYAIQEAIKK